MRKNFTNQYKILKIDTFSGGGGGTQFYVWTKRFYGHLGVSNILSADNSGRFLQNPRGIAQIAGGQNQQSMRVKRSDPQKDWNFTFSRFWPKLLARKKLGPELGASLKITLC